MSVQRKRECYLKRLILDQSGSRSGFTLIELMVVVGILALTMAVAVPTISAWLPRYRVGSAARDIGSKLQMARLSAASNTTNYRIFINTSARPYSIQLEKWDTSLDPDDWTFTGVYEELHDDVQVGAVTPTSTDAEDLEICRPDGTKPLADGIMVVFQPNGSVSSAVAGSEIQIPLTNVRGDQYFVRVSNTTGRVRIDKN